MVSLRVHKETQTYARLVFFDDYVFMLLKLIACGICVFLLDVRAHCYCASLVRTLFIRHTRATSFSSACTKSKSQQNIELMTFALTWCGNIFVECSVTPKGLKKSVRGNF